VLTRQFASYIFVEIYLPAEILWSSIVIYSDQPLPHPNLLEAIRRGASSKRGLAIALAIIGFWAGSLVFLLSLDLSKVPVAWVVLAMLGQTFLYTGLFITAHDAMHGVVSPQNLRLNNLIGSFTLLVYGLFSYRKLLKKHWLHHHHPASELDPDFHNGRNKNFFAWYLYFMKGYWSWWRLFGLMAIFNIASIAFHIPEKNLTLFWVIPSIASSVQLFYFGTFRPHQEPEQGYDNQFRARTYPLPSFWSFITCYHFGYHREHHEFPQVPWWQLPTVHRLEQEKSSA
jgi:beta-carotene/zeaxanthin 4-ketolase